MPYDIVVIEYPLGHLRSAVSAVPPPQVLVHPQCPSLGRVLVKGYLLQILWECEAFSVLSWTLSTNITVISRIIFWILTVLIYIKIMSRGFSICREYVPYRSQAKFLLEQHEWKQSLDGPEEHHVFAGFLNWPLLRLTGWIIPVAKEQQHLLSWGTACRLSASVKR